MPAEERLEVAEIDYRRILEERHNFDWAGHYARPDVTRLEVNWQSEVLATTTD